MSAEKEQVIKFESPINGFIGAKKVVINGQEVWVKIAPTKKAKGYKKSVQRAKG